jgi:predicted type IV restriction endonuclease
MGLDGSNFQLLAEYTVDRGTAGSLLLATDGNFWVAEYNNGTTGYGDIVTLSPSDGAMLEERTRRR